MSDWKLGDRVTHATFGSGTVLQVDPQHIVIHFDQRGRKTLATNVVVLAAATEVATPAHRSAARPPEHLPVAGPAMTIEQLLDEVRRAVVDAASFTAFITRMRRTLPSTGHQYEGVVSGMRLQRLQTWLLDVNAQRQLTDAQLLAIVRVEFPFATGELFTGDIDAGLRHVDSVRAAYNGGSPTSASAASRGVPPSVSYGTF